MRNNFNKLVSKVQKTPTSLFLAILFLSLITACQKAKQPIAQKEKYFSAPADLQTENLNISGLLYSQVGYDLNRPVKAVIRMPEKSLLPENAVCHLENEFGEKVHEGKISYWGDLWKSHWWNIDFDITEVGEWSIVVKSGEEELFRGVGFRVVENILWNSTYKWSSVDMLSRRKHFTGIGIGWQDAGSKWVESPAQSAMIIALTDIVNYPKREQSDEFLSGLYEQIMIGADYLVHTQIKAKELGYPKGSFCHDVFGHEDIVIANNGAKAAVALYKSIQVLPDSVEEKKQAYKEAADLAFEWLTTVAKPSGKKGLNLKQRGLPEDTQIPEDEWLTSDLISLCWASLERYKAGDESAKEFVVSYAKQIMARQITKEAPESGFYGHFKEFETLPHSQNLWIHGVGAEGFGADVGNIFPNYLMPFCEMITLWSDHEDASKWKQTLHNYAYGFLIPACDANPFKLVPNGIFGKEGPIWFAGPFHGTNAIYGYTAALAAKMSNIFDEPKLDEIAVANLQWVAGLNSGITKESLVASVIFSMEIPEGVALPGSMICGIGNRTIGTWFITKGVVCNGFSTGREFVMDVDPLKENDGPFSFTDEDWIPHSAAWLTGLMHLNN